MSENLNRRSFLKKSIVASAGAALGLSGGCNIDRQSAKGKKVFRVDTHQHFWHYNTKYFGWIDDSMSTLRRDFLPKDLEAELRKNSIDLTVSIQARQILEETDWLLALAKQNRFIKGVVGWVPLRSNSLETDLERFSQDKKLKGIRHCLEAEADDKYMLRDDFLRGISKLEKFDLTYDLLIRPRHIKYSVELVDKFPNQMFVVDHIAKPFIKEGKMEPWKRDLQQLARRENVYCKLSGMVLRASRDSSRQGFNRYMEAVLEMFGPERLMFGSDWPVCTAVVSYGQFLGIVRGFISSLSPAEQAKIMGLNAARFYNLEI